MRKPRYRYCYKDVCWVLMEYETAITKAFPMMLSTSLHTRDWLKLYLANKFDGGQPYQV